MAEEMKKRDQEVQAIPFGDRSVTGSKGGGGGKHTPGFLSFTIEWMVMSFTVGGAASR